MAAKVVALVAVGIHSAAAFAPSFSVAGIRPAAQVCQNAVTTAAPVRRPTLGLRMAEGDAAAMTVEDLKIGNSYPGTVTSIVPFGAFVNIGCGTDGLVHVSELADGYVAEVTSVVNKGDTVDVRVVDVSEGRNGKTKVALSMRDPNAPRAGRKPAGGRVKKEVPEHMKDADPSQFIDGTVASVTDFGAFVTVAEGVDGLCHVSQLAEERVESTASVVSVGDKVQVRILEYDHERGRLALSMKQP